MRARGPRSWVLAASTRFSTMSKNSNSRSSSAWTSWRASDWSLRCWALDAKLPRCLRRLPQVSRAGWQALRSMHYALAHAALCWEWSTRCPRMTSRGSYRKQLLIPSPSWTLPLVWLPCPNRSRRHRRNTCCRYYNGKMWSTAPKSRGSKANLSSSGAHALWVTLRLPRAHLAASALPRGCPTSHRNPPQTAARSKNRAARIRGH
mmetsp:Transcript_9208/g.24164  ORF Transcript_9208/g.24164 Transcript_9208/m.24164 type:complete len:205 (-) Transcript_9208:1226-1840(-)